MDNSKIYIPYKKIKKKAQKSFLQIRCNYIVGTLIFCIASVKTSITLLLTSTKNQTSFSSFHLNDVAHIMMIETLQYDAEI